MIEDNITLEEIQRLKDIEQKQKKRYKKQNEYTNKLYDRISFTVPKGRKKAIEDMAKSMGLTVNKFISEIILKTVDNKNILEMILNNNNIEELPQDPIQTTQEAEISHEKEEVKETAKEPEKPLETTAITFNTTEELNDYVLKKQAENKVGHEAEAQQVKQEEEIPEQPLCTDVEDAEIDRRLKQTLVYREQVKKEREIYGEFTPEIIHEFVAKMGAEIKTPDNRARIVEKFGQINYDSLIAYMDSKKI